MLCVSERALDAAFSEWVWAFLQAVAKCVSVFYCIVQNAFLQRGRDDAFVSRVYADVCPSATNVTSHNPPKITPVSPNYAYAWCWGFFNLIFSFFKFFYFFWSHVSDPCHRAVGCGWVKRVSIHWFNTNISLIMQHPVIFCFLFFWTDTIMEFSVIPSICHIASASSMTNPGGNF